MNKSMKPSTTKVEPKTLSKEEQDALMKERRNQEAFGQRAKIALSFVPVFLEHYPDMSDEEIIERSTSLAEVFMDKLLGVKFESTKETNEDA